MTDNLNRNEFNIEEYLNFGDVTLIADHFGLTRRAVYNQLRYKSNSLKAHEVRGFAVNMLSVRVECLQKVIPVLKERVSSEYSTKVLN